MEQDTFIDQVSSFENTAHLRQNVVAHFIREDLDGGAPAALDEFDEYYIHLFLWNSATKEIVGAYRLGRVDEIQSQFGTRGLYTSTLFDYDSDFLGCINPAL